MIEKAAPDGDLKHTQTAAEGVGVLQVCYIQDSAKGGLHLYCGGGIGLETPGRTFGATIADMRNRGS